VANPPAFSIKKAIGALSYSSLNLAGDFSVAILVKIPSYFMNI